MFILLLVICDYIPSAIMSILLPHLHLFTHSAPRVIEEANELLVLRGDGVMRWGATVAGPPTLAAPAHWLEHRPRGTHSRSVLRPPRHLSIQIQIFQLLTQISPGPDDPAGPTGDLVHGALARPHTTLPPPFLLFSPSPQLFSLVSHFEWTLYFMYYYCWYLGMSSTSVRVEFLCSITSFLLVSIFLFSVFILVTQFSLATLSCLVESSYCCISGGYHFSSAHTSKDPRVHGVQAREMEL